MIVLPDESEAGFLFAHFFPFLYTTRECDIKTFME